MANRLGIDYGTKRIGLAFADELRVPVPLPAVPGVDDSEWLECLATVVDGRGANELVVGYPLHMDGSAGTRAKEVDAFADRLAERFGLPVRKVDERLSSQEAAAGMKLSRKRMPGKESGVLDSAAAVVILRDFLEANDPTLLPPPDDWDEEGEGDL